MARTFWQNLVLFLIYVSLAIFIAIVLIRMQPTGWEAYVGVFSWTVVAYEALNTLNKMKGIK